MSLDLNNYSKGQAPYNPSFEGLLKHYTPIPWKAPSKGQAPYDPSFDGIVPPAPPPSKPPAYVPHMVHRLDKIFHLSHKLHIKF